MPRVALALALALAVLPGASLAFDTAGGEPRGWAADATPETVRDMATDAEGNLVVLAADPPRVVTISPKGRLISSWGRQGNGPARFEDPTSIAMAPSGNVLVGDAGTRVREFTADGRFVQQWPYQGGAIAVGPTGEVYAVGDSRILVYDSTGRLLDEWRSEDWRDRGYQVSGDPGVVRPMDVGVGLDSNVYVLDSFREVEVFTPAGVSLGGWSAPSWYMNDSASGFGVGGNLVVVIADSGLASRFTSDGNALGTMGTPVDYEADDWDSGATGLSDDTGLTINPSDAAIAPDGSIYVSGGALHGPERIIRLPPPRTSADPSHSDLSFATGAPRFIPMGYDSATSLTAVVRDAAGQPVNDLEVTIAGRRTNGAFGSLGAAGISEPACRAGRQPGEYQCKVTGHVGALGGYEVRLVDVATGSTLAGPVHLEATRKVVVLAMGFRSALTKRFCYWGPDRRSGQQDCEDRIDEVLADDGSVYGKLAALGYRADRSFADPGATILDVGWEPRACGDALCIAEVGNQAHDATWTPWPYDIGNIRESTSRQLAIDEYARYLVETLRRYDEALADPKKGIGAHASFHLIGHSMGGELVVRALNAALANPYFTDSAHRGLLRTVISVDGALNWGTTYTPLSPPAPSVGLFGADALSGKGMVHCGKSPVYTLPDPKKEVENANAAQLANELMGTTTIALTNGNDWMVPYDSDLVEIPVALLESPVKPRVGYGTRLFWGYGEGKAGDPGCGHSTLLRAQPGGLYTSDKWDDQGVDPRRYAAKNGFPLGGLIEKFIGEAAWEG